MPANTATIEVVIYQLIMFYPEAEVELTIGKMLLQHVLDVMYKKATVHQKRQICL